MRASRVEADVEAGTRAPFKVSPQTDTTKPKISYWEIQGRYHTSERFDCQHIFNIRSCFPWERGRGKWSTKILAVTPSDMRVKYGASKAAVLGISRTDACAYGKDGIRVNSVCPGYIRTPRTSRSRVATYIANEDSA